MKINHKDLINKIIEEPIINIIEIIDRGLVNKIYIVELSDKKVVVRLNQDDVSIFEKEKWCSEISLEKGVLTPKVFKVGVIENYSYMVQEYIEGVNGDEYDNEDRIWLEVGKYAKKLHSVKYDVFGEDFLNYEKGESSSTWDKFLQYNIESLNSDDQLIKMSVINLKQLATIKEMLIKLRKKKFEMGLIHHDLSLNNTIISKKGELFLLDWGSAGIHLVPHWDLIEVLSSSCDVGTTGLDQFLKGYGISKEEFNKMYPDLQVMLLVRALDKLRWAIDRGPDLIDDYAFRVIKLVDKFIESKPKVIAI